MRLLRDPLREEIGSPSGDSFLGRKTGLQLLPSPTHPPRAACLRTNEDRLYKVLGGSRGHPVSPAPSLTHRSPEDLLGREGEMSRLDPAAAQRGSWGLWV